MPKSHEVAWAQLGRLGDVINILPLLHQEFTQTGIKPHLLLHRDYFPLISGVSYIEPFLWDGNFADLKGAMAYARIRYSDFKITQIYGWGLSFQKKTDSFIKESYQRVGKLEWFNKLPLIFDQRNYQREKALRDKLTEGKPYILTALRGFSSPFAHGVELVSLIEAKFSPNYKVINLSRVTAPYFYDLLGLMDNARALVTIDTAHLHLARASKVPTIALVADGPTPWHASAPLTGQVLRMHYREFAQRKGEIIEAIAKTGHHHNAAPKVEVSKVVQIVSRDTLPRKGRQLIHLWNSFGPQGDHLRRHQFAKSTWESEYADSNWLSCPIVMEELPRTSKETISDTRSLPYIRDLFDIAITKSQARKDDIMVFTNDDVSMVKGIGKWLLSVRSDHPAFAHRWDFPRLTEHLTTERVRTGCWCCGTDLFAFTPSWWQAQRSLYPDFILAGEAWDWILRETMKLSGGFELHSMLYHESHLSVWQSGRNRYTLPCNQWNQRLAKQWLVERGKPLRELQRV